MCGDGHKSHSSVNTLSGFLVASHKSKDRTSTYFTRKLQCDLRDEQAFAATGISDTQV